MEISNCQEKLKYAEREWNKLKQRLEQCELALKRAKSALEQTEKELNKLALASQKHQACQSSLQEAYKLISQLKKEKTELLKFKKYVRHPDVWIENASDPLAKALQTAGIILATKTPKAQAESKDPTDIVRSWAYKLYELISSNIDQPARKEIEIYLIALWYWIRLEEIVARFEVE